MVKMGYHYGMQSLQELIVGATVFVNNVLLPLLFGLALLFFFWNATKFFIIGASEPESKENAKRLAVYGIGAFVLLVSLWGIVNMLVSGLGWDEVGEVLPDYFDNTGYYGGYSDPCDRDTRLIDCQ